MQIWKSIRKIFNFEFSFFSLKHILNSQYEYANEWVDDVIASQFSMYFVHWNDEIPIFQLWESKTCLKSTLNNLCRIMFALIYFDMGRGFYMFATAKKKKKNIKHFKYKMRWKIMKRWDHKLTLCIFISTVQEMFHWKLWKFKISYLPHFLSDLHQIFTVLFEKFYSFYWINLNLNQISPLTRSLRLPSLTLYKVYGGFRYTRMDTG